MDTIQPAAAPNNEIAMDVELASLDTTATSPAAANEGVRPQAAEEEITSEPRHPTPNGDVPSPAASPAVSGELMLDLSKYILLLATLVATVTYAAAFSPPGGVWQDTNTTAGRFAGDSIIRTTSYRRYLVFYYCNATAFASSLVVIAMVLSLVLLHEKWNRPFNIKTLHVAMVLDLLSLMGGYAAGTCRDTVTTAYSSALVGLAFAYLIFQTVVSFQSGNQSNSSNGATVDKRLRKVLMLLATFAISVTYVAGMTTPGGFWDAGSGHPPGHAILEDGHGKRLTVFLCFNASAFFASLVIVMVLLDKRPHMKMPYACITVALVSLVVAYTAGSCRQTDTTVYVSSLVGAVFAFIVLLQLVVVQGWIETVRATCFWKKIEGFKNSASNKLRKMITSPGTNSGSLQNGSSAISRNTVDKASSLVLLLATLAATITYQAGLNPPGGVWSDNGSGHMAGDPILLTTDARRFKVFFYCNSIAFVASLVAIILVQNKILLETHVLEAAMILDLFGLIGAYAAGSCRDVNTSLHAMALAGAVLVYVVVHVVFVTLNHADTIPHREIELVEKRRKRLLLLAVLAATITYQAGLTPPGGFQLQNGGSSSGYYAGDPVLLYNFPHRYKAFFYCNSVSFMLSISLIILLVNRHVYRPAIRSYALDICTAAGMLALMGAYATGSTQHLKTSIYIFVLVAVVLFFIGGLVLYSHKRNGNKEGKTEHGNPDSQPRREINDSKEGKTENGNSDSKPKEPANNDETEKVEKAEKERHAKRKYLMLLGILVASVTYQAGLSPPGGTWQSDTDLYSAGDPVMHYNRRPRYLVFFYSNSASFVASIVVIVLLLPQWWNNKQWSLKVMNTVIFLDLLALLGAYAAGSSRGWKTSMYVVALIAAVLAYVAIHIILALSCPHSPSHENLDGQENPQSHEQTNGRVQTPLRTMSLP